MFSSGLWIGIEPNTDKKKYYCLWNENQSYTENNYFKGVKNETET